MKTFLAALFATMLPFAYAQTPAQAPLPRRAPWDNRPNKCLAPAAAAMPGCEAPPDWPTYSITVQHMRMLWMNPNFDLIERGENELGYSNGQFETGSYYFEAWMDGLTAGVERPAEQVASLIERWTEAKGDQGFVKVFEALQWQGNAWAARGGGFARTVAPEAWDLFYKNLARANAVLDTASPKVRHSGPWYLLKLRLAFEDAKLNLKASDLIAEAAKSWPDSIDLARIPMDFAHPKWGGSFEAMDEAARAATKRSSKHLGMGMYPLLYAATLGGDGRFTLADTHVDWPMMKQGFHALEPTKFADPATWHRFAKFACDMRDREEAKRLYAIRDAKKAATTSNPSSFNSDADACHAYAFGTKDA